MECLTKSAELRSEETLSEILLRPSNMTGSVGINVTLRRVCIAIVAVEKQ